MTGYSNLARQLSERSATLEVQRYRRSLDQTARLLLALESHAVPDEELKPFTAELESAVRESEWRSVKRVYSTLVKHLEKQHGLVLPGHYQGEWMAIGMAAFGLPLGAAFSAALDSAAYIGIGLPIGLAIGSALGARKDQQARAEGRVLEVNADSE